MRIGVLCRFSYPDDIGGIGVVHDHLVKQLKKNDVHFFMICPGSSEDNFSESQSEVAFSEDYSSLVEIHNKGLYSGQFNPNEFEKELVEYAEKLVPVFNEKNIQLLMGYTAIDWCLGWRIADKIGVPFVGVLHGGIAPKMKFLAEASTDRVALGRLKINDFVVSDFFDSRRYNKLIAVSHYVKKRYIEWEVPEEDIQVIYNGIDLNHFGSEDRKGGSLYGGAPSILLPARPVPRKGYSSLIAALGELKNRYENMKVIICPLTELNALSKDLADYYELTDHIIGRCYTYSQIPSVYRNVDLVVLPSIEEPFGIPVIEAMASGVPIITTNDGAFPELIEHEESGLLYEALDFTDMKNKIISALENQKLRKKIIDGGYERAKFFTAEKMAMNYFKLWEELIE
jgi:glycosyltransferase involved in cell wall biosynthesis